jgi:hypothetical protein
VSSALSQSKPIRRFGRLSLAAAISLLLVTGQSNAQSITAGLLEGTVLHADRSPFPEAWIRVEDTATGASWSVIADQYGRFRLTLLPPSRYDVSAEAIGYQPVRLEGVEVRPGRRQHVSITLTTVELPVDEVTVEPFTASSARSRAGASQWFSQLEIADLPDGRREITELGRLSTISTPELATEALPGWLSDVVVDGVPYAATLHPDLRPGRTTVEAFPLSSLQAAELFNNATDVEWSGAAGGYLSGYSRRGTRRPSFQLYGDWSGGVVTYSDHFEGRDLGTHSYRGGAVLGGPIVGDTAHFSVGFEAQGLETPVPRAWEIDTLDARLQAIAASYGENIAAYTQPRIVNSDIYSAFGRFDWHVTQNHSVTVRGNVGGLQVGGDDDRDPDLAADRIASLGSKIEGVDLSTAATVSNRFGNTLAHELRFGVDRSDRDYRGTSLLGTDIVDGGLAFGTDPAIPGEFKRLGIRAATTWHIFWGRQLLKAGVAADFESVEHRYTYADGGVFAFAGPDEFARLEGSFVTVDGMPPPAKYRNWQLSAYLQDTWAAAPGLEILLGVRYDYELLDSAQVRLNEDWFELTGLANTSFNNDLSKWSGRFGFVWDISQRHEFLVRGSAGIYHDRIRPAVYGELVGENGLNSLRRGVGTLDSWPDPPGLGTAPLVGPRLTLLGPKFYPPRTGRASLGLSWLFDAATAFHVSGAYRFTDHLPRRADLNLAASPSSVDQYGRPVYGTLVQQGSLITVEPLSNRRFPSFGLVSALNADGNSKYWGATASIERHQGEWLNLIAAYTISWSEDDWLSAVGGGPERQLNPFPGGLGGTDWSESRSDLDAPHSAVVGAEAILPAGLARARLGLVYRYSSGQRFTPGFRAGVDVNGDGSGLNDPAFVDPELIGMQELVAQWDCLADQVGQFAERNSCVGPGMHRLDARFALGVAKTQGWTLEVIADALNLLDTDIGARDAALLLIDRAGSIEENLDGSLTLPLAVNPNFGEVLARRSSGRALRLGLRIGF